MVLPDRGVELSKIMFFVLNRCANNVFITNTFNFNKPVNKKLFADKKAHLILCRIIVFKLPMISVK